MFVNRYGAYSNPTRSMEEFIDFIGSKDALESAFDYMAAPEAIKASADVMDGLDTWMSSEDRNVVEYYKKYIKDSH